MGVAFGHRRIVELLIQHKADVNIAESEKNISPLSLAIVMLNAEIVEILLKQGANLEVKDKRGNTPLIGATKMSMLPGVEKLLAYGANLEERDEDGCTPLYIAVRAYNDYALIEFLLSKGANPNQPNKAGKILIQKALGLAFTFRNRGIPKLFITH